MGGAVCAARPGRVQGSGGRWPRSAHGTHRCHRCAVGRGSRAAPRCGPRRSAASARKVFAAHVALEAVVHRRVWPRMARSMSTTHCASPVSGPGWWRVQDVLVHLRHQGFGRTGRAESAWPSRRCAPRCACSRASRWRRGTTGPVPRPPGLAVRRAGRCAAMRRCSRQAPGAWCRGRHAASGPSCATGAVLLRSTQGVLAQRWPRDCHCASSSALWAGWRRQGMGQKKSGHAAEQRYSMSAFCTCKRWLRPAACGCFTSAWRT